MHIINFIEDALPCLRVIYGKGCSSFTIKNKKEVILDVDIRMMKKELSCDRIQTLQVHLIILKFIFRGEIQFENVPNYTFYEKSFNLYLFVSQISFSIESNSIIPILSEKDHLIEFYRVVDKVFLVNNILFFILLLSSFISDREVILTRILSPQIKNVLVVIITLVKFSHQLQGYKRSKDLQNILRTVKTHKRIQV